MDDLAHGTRDARGNWAPNEPLRIAPIYALPPRLSEVLAWLPGYFLPWNVLFALSAVAYWAWVIPDVETTRTLSPGWIAWLYAVNAAAVAAFYGAFEYRLYRRRAQGTRFKYNPRWPSEHRSGTFWFKDQNLDNVARTFLSGVTIWTGMEVLYLWAHANGWAPALPFAEHPVHLGLLALAVPLIHELHFFCIHRLIHTPWLYRHVHSVHHKAVNPSPWSSLAMHSVEHALYFSSVLYHLVIPSNPVIALYQLHFAGFGAIPGHVGFEKMEVGETRGVDSHAYAHYLHHKFFEVNYGDGLVPLDRLFGTWHDGTPEGDRLLKARRQRRSARAASGRKPA